MTKDEAIHKALKVLNCLNNDRVYETAWVKGAINACEEALEQPTVAELNDEYLRDTNVIGLEQPAEPRLVSYALDGSTCTLNIDGEEVYFNREQPAKEPVAWISVEDKLPSVLDIVLVYGKHKSEKSRSGNYELVDTATYYDWSWEKNGSKGWYCPRLTSDYDEVTYWMPLPKYPIYTHPHQWQRLTDDEISHLFVGHTAIDFARAIEQALKDKNHV